MTITVTQMQSLVGRFTNSIVNEQVNMECPYVGKGMIEKVKKVDKVGVVNIKAGQLRSVSWIGDAGALPSGADVQPVQATYLPVGLFGRISIPRIASHLASSLEDGIDIVKEEMESAGKTIAQQLGRGIFGSSLGAPAATVNAGSTTFEVADPSGWRNGMGFEIYFGSTAIEGYSDATLLYVTNVSIGTGTGGNTVITFVGTGVGGTNVSQWLTTYTFYLRGAGDSSRRMVSLQDVTAAASLYGQSQTTNDWSGNLDSTAEPLSISKMRDMLDLVVRRRGQKPKCLVANRKNERRYSDLLINNRRFPSGKMDAVGGLAHEFEGLPLFLDENVGDSQMFFFNSEDVKLHEFRAPSPEFHGGSKKGMDRGAVLISDSQLVYDVQILGIYNLRVTRRNGTGLLSSISG